MPSRMPTEGTKMLCLHPPKRLFRLRLRTCGGNTGQEHLQRGPTGTNEDQQPSNPSNPSLPDPDQYWNQGVTRGCRLSWPSYMSSNAGGGGGGGGLRGHSKWVQLCTWSPNKLNLWLKPSCIRHTELVRKESANLPYNTWLPPPVQSDEVARVWPAHLYRRSESSSGQLPGRGVPPRLGPRSIRGLGQALRSHTTGSHRGLLDCCG